MLEIGFEGDLFRFRDWNDTEAIDHPGVHWPLLYVVSLGKHCSISKDKKLLVIINAH
jgi:hypothetical protein